jgi:hypothetical protein
MCELDTADATPSTEVITDGSRCDTVYGNNNRWMWEVHTLEIVGLGNEMESELPVTISTAQSEIWTTEHLGTTTETIPAAIEIVVKA